MAGVFSRIGSLSAQAFIANLVLLVLAVLVARASANSTWTNPCSKSNIRQVRSTAEKELKYLISTLNHQLFDELGELYPVADKSKTNCPRINKLINSIKKEQNITAAYKRFHKAMLEMSIFLDQLMNMKIVTDIKIDREKRRGLYLRTQNALRLAICEFNETIMHDYKVVPYNFSGYSNRRNCLPQQADFTHLRTLDTQFFIKLKRLFKAGKATLKKLKHKTHRQANKVKKEQNQHSGNKKRHGNGHLGKNKTASKHKKNASS